MAIKPLETALGMSIVEFFECPWILNDQEISPVQKVILKSLRGEELDTETSIPLDHVYQSIKGMPYNRIVKGDFKNEVDMFCWFSGKKTYEPTFYSDADLCLGRRSGKSTKIGAGLALFFATQFDFKPYLRTTPHATIPLISPTKEQAGEVFAAIKSMILRSPYIFETFLDGNIDGFDEEYSEDMAEKGKLTGGIIKLNNRVHIKVMAADTSKIRGMAVPFAILDEINFFGDDASDNKNTDQAIYEALAPSLLQFQEVDGMAMVLRISSPNGQTGLMFNNYERCEDEDILHFQVPSWYANNIVAVKYLEKQLKKYGEAYFLREYGALYVASEKSYLDPVKIDEAVLGIGTIDYDPKYRYVAAMDFASKNDLWAFAIGHKEYVFDTDSKQKLERIQIDLLCHWQGKGGNELNPDTIMAQICMMLKHYRVSYCLADQYAYAPLRIIAQKPTNGCVLKEFKISATSKYQFMYSLQVALNTGALKMVNNPVAVRHLKDLREIPMAERASVKPPRITHAPNCHDDYAIVIGLVAYQFDKTCPLYVGMHKAEKSKIGSTKDLTGKHVAYPTAEEMAEQHGVAGFYDNRDLEEAKKEEEENGAEEKDGNDFWFIF